MGGESHKGMRERKHIYKFKEVNSHLIHFQHSFLECLVHARLQAVVRHGPCPWQAARLGARSGHWVVLWQGHEPGTRSAQPRTSENWLWRMSEVGHTVKGGRKSKQKEHEAKGTRHKGTAMWDICHTRGTSDELLWLKCGERQTTETIIWVTITAWERGSDQLVLKNHGSGFGVRIEETRLRAKAMRLANDNNS